jgi:hypothetical protein
MSIKQWIRRYSVMNRRTAARRPAQGFAAGHSTGSALQHDAIRDISATGVYLLTRERWQSGTSVALTLHRAGRQNDNLQSQITLKARAVRCGEDGVGLAFEIPAGVDQRLWTRLVETSPVESSADDIVGPFKMAKALAFLSRVSAPSGSAIRQQIRSTLTGQRLWNAIEIALLAENVLASSPHGDRLRSSMPIIVRILHDGSWAEDDSTKLCWAGLLATACTPIIAEESNRSLVEIFSQLTPTHVRFFTAVCTLSTKYLNESGAVAARRLTSTTDEILKLSGTRDLLRMGRSLEHLSELGLLEERFKTSLFIPVDGINITPTILGLKLFARCMGHRGSPESFYGIGPTGGRHLPPWPDEGWDSAPSAMTG